MTIPKHFDLAIVGGGAAAFAGAIRANELGAKTVLINDGLPLGGTCVNVGCVPTKALLHIAEARHNALKNDIPGLDLKVESFDFAEAISHEQELVSEMRSEKYSKVLARLEHVSLLEGRAKLNSNHELIVGDDTLHAAYILLATGSTVTRLDIPGLSESGHVTHIEALRNKTLPKRLAIIGAGAVGLEFAQMYSRFGAMVTVLARGARIARNTEPALSLLMAEALRAEGINILLETSVTQVSANVNSKTLSLQSPDGLKNLQVDEILVAAGKTPNTADLGLRKAGVETDPCGAIAVSTEYQTVVDNIYAVGDVAALPLRLEPTAGKEGTIAVSNMLSGDALTIDFDSTPFTIFTDPELAGVGWTEAEMMTRLGTCLCKTVSFENVPRAIITGRTEGAITIVAEPDTRIIRGIHILAPHAGELIAQAMTIVANKNTISDVVNSLPMFPTLSESIKLAALSFDVDISQLSCCV